MNNAFLLSMWLMQISQVLAAALLLVECFNAKMWAISSDTHQLAPLYNIIIIVDTVLRQKRNFKHEK